MGRNPELDAREKAARRQQILENSFRIFAEKAIDSLSMNEIADACGVGVATLYRYFITKSALVLEVNTWAWENFTRENSVRLNQEETTAAEQFAFFLDTFLVLYREHRDLLRFNQFFNVYIRREEITPEQLAPFETVVRGVAERFHRAWEKGRADGTLRTDVPEGEMFSAVLHLMLAAATRYAVGLVYQEGAGPERELELLKKMLLREYTTEKS